MSKSEAKQSGAKAVSDRSRFVDDDPVSHTKLCATLQSGSASRVWNFSGPCAGQLHNV